MEKVGVSVTGKIGVSATRKMVFQQQGKWCCSNGKMVFHQQGK